MRFSPMENPGEHPGGEQGDVTGLEDVIAELRREETVRPEWRARLEHELASLSVPDGTVVQRGHARSREESDGRTNTRGWHLRPLTAMAAALTFTVLGALGSSTVSSLLRARESGARETGAAVIPAATAATAPASPGTSNARTATVDGSNTGVRFAVQAPGVKRVSLVGDFNGWNPAATPLSLSRDGRTWTVLLPLTAGRHTYAFVIDDEIVADPAAPRSIDDDFGTPSSFVLVDHSRGTMP